MSNLKQKLTAPALILSLISGSFAVFIANQLDSRVAEKLQEGDHQHAKDLLKREVFQSLVGSRHLWIKPCSTGEDEEFFIALNKVFIAYDEDQEVIEAVVKLHEDRSKPKEPKDEEPEELSQDAINLLNLIKAMAEAGGVPIDPRLDDDFLSSPISPDYTRLCKYLPE